MKIFFYDGNLNDFKLSYWSIIYEVLQPSIVDAGEGPTNVRNSLENILNLDKKDSKHLCVLTNSIIALDNDFAWDSELNRSEIYIWRDSVADFVNIHGLTDKEIRFAHNIAKMYLAGAFDLE